MASVCAIAAASPGFVAAEGSVPMTSATAARNSLGSVLPTETDTLGTAEHLSDVVDDVLFGLGRHVRSLSMMSNW